MRRRRRDGQRRVFETRDPDGAMARCSPDARPGASCTAPSASARRRAAAQHDAQRLRIDSLIIEAVSTAWWARRETLGTDRQTSSTIASARWATGCDAQDPRLLPREQHPGAPRAAQRHCGARAAAGAAPAGWFGAPRAADRLRLRTSADAPAPSCLVSFRDITEQHASALALEAAELRWRFALEGAGAGVGLRRGQHSGLLLAGLEVMLGYAEAEISALLGEWTQRIHPRRPCGR